MSRIQCPHCGNAYQLTPEKHAQYAGKKIACKSCQKTFVVPAMEVAPAREEYELEMAAPAPAYAPAPSLPPATAAGMPRHVGLNRPRVHEEEESNGWAKGSLVSAVAGLIVPVVPAAIAVLLGIVALIKARRPNVSGRGTAIAGIVIAVVGVGLHGLLVSAALPRVRQAREIANRVQCAAHLRQIARAMELYAKTTPVPFPAHLDELLLVTQGLTPQDLICPDAPEDTPVSGATPTAQAAALRASPQGHLSYIYLCPKSALLMKDQILLYEPPEHHVDGMNAVLGNWSVVWFDAEDTKWVLSELGKGFNPPRQPEGGWRKY